jgi:hypothetical protein
MIVDPSGKSLGLSLHLLDGLPIDSFLWPGIAMIVGNAVIPVLAVIAALRRVRWAYLAHVGVGMLLSSWLLLQVTFVGAHHTLQLMFLALGVAIALLAIQDSRTELAPRHRVSLR